MDKKARSRTARTNPDLISNRFKLLYHRLVARKLRRDPALIESARSVIESRPFTRTDRTYVDEWRRLLGQPVSSIARVLTSRSPESNRLRLSSPFPFVDALKINDEELRRRLWSAAKKPFANPTSRRRQN